MSERARPSAGRMAAAVGIGLVIAVAMLQFLERHLIYFPARDLHTLPSALALAYEDVELETADGTHIHGWFLPAASPSVRAGVLFAHGNAGNMADRLHFARLLHDHVPAHVLMFDYRGYGRSGGDPDEPGLYDDAVAALAALRARPEVDPTRIVIMGRSLGGGVAAGLAVRDGAAAGVILESTFTSIAAMARATYPIPGLSALVKTRFDNLAKVPRIEAPLLVIHGELDEMIPVAMGRQLANAGQPGTQLHVVPRGYHNDTWVAGGTEYAEVLAAFVRRVAVAEPL